MEQKYSIYDFPELLYNSKILTNRQRCIVLCLFSFLNLRGGGAFTIDILAEKTGIRKEHLYRELKSLTYTKEVDGVKKEFSIIKREGKKISLDIERLKEFISAKLASSSNAKVASDNCQNGTKKLPKQHLDSAKLAVSKCQNGTKTSAEAQEPQSPEPPVDNIIRKKVLDKNSQIKVLEGDNNKAPEKGDNVLDDSKKQINREIIRNVVEKIASEFKAKYKAKFNRYPIIDKASTKRIEEALANSATDFEELKDLSRHLIQKIPDYFKLRDKWVREKGYSWFAFSYRVGDLLSEPVKCQATNTPGVDFKLTLSRI